MRVEVVELPAWHGGLLAAEYDAEEDVVRVNTRAVEAVRSALGDRDAEAFIACAIAHEWFHRNHHGADEARAHAFARAHAGVDPARFDAALRARGARA